jgi:DNA-binding NarL/FixJ family response regulator
MHYLLPHDSTVDRIRVLIADDMSRIRAVLRDLLEHDGRFEVVAEASDGLEAVRQTELERPDAAVLDECMPNLDGIEALPRIHACSPGTRVVVLSSFGAREMSSRALEAGACAYLEKGSSASNLIETLVDACATAEPADALPLPAANPA